MFSFLFNTLINLYLGSEFRVLVVVVAFKQIFCSKKQKQKQTKKTR